MPHLKYCLLLMPLLLVAACDQAVQGSNRAADATQRAFHDTTNKWKGLFMYNPQKEDPQMPQTRYCYSMQTDILCYDSPQPNMTAAMRGYQDGANISWYQPGGGSLGASGGEPTATYQTQQVQAAPPTMVNYQSGELHTQSNAETGTMATGTPFYVGESAYEKNAVISNEIAASKTSTKQ